MLLGQLLRLRRRFRTHLLLGVHCERRLTPWGEPNRRGQDQQGSRRTQMESHCAPWRAMCSRLRVHRTLDATAVAVNSGTQRASSRRVSVPGCRRSFLSLLLVLVEHTLLHVSKGRLLAKLSDAIVGKVGTHLR